MKKFEDALNEFQELFSVAAYNMTIEDALSKGVCVKCKSKFVIHPCIFNKKDISNNEKGI